MCVHRPARALIDLAVAPEVPAAGTTTADHRLFISAFFLRYWGFQALHGAEFFSDIDNQYGGHYQFLTILVRPSQSSSSVFASTTILT